MRGSPLFAAAPLAALSAGNERTAAIGTFFAALRNADKNADKIVLAECRRLGAPEAAEQ